VNRNAALADINVRQKKRQHLLTIELPIITVHENDLKRRVRLVVELASSILKLLSQWLRPIKIASVQANITNQNETLRTSMIYPFQLSRDRKITQHTIKYLHLSE